LAHATRLLYGSQAYQHSTTTINPKVTIELARLNSRTVDFLRHIACLALFQIRLPRTPSPANDGWVHPTLCITTMVFSMDPRLLDDSWRSFITQGLYLMLIGSRRLYFSLNVCHRTWEGLIHCISSSPKSVCVYSNETSPIRTTAIVQQFAVCSVDHNAR
jgi:hypothetical protein